MCGKEDPTLPAKEVSLYGGRDWGVLKITLNFWFFWRTKNLVHWSGIGRPIGLNKLLGQLRNDQLIQLV
jgi:hypothetical protein